MGLRVMRRLLFRGLTLDDVTRSVFHEIVSRGEDVKPSKGPAREITGVVLELSNPRARLSRTENRGKLFSALGELCWYLAGTNSAEFVIYYIGHYKEFVENDRIYGGYGPRLFSWKGVNQIKGIIKLLRRNPDSRKAVIQLFDARDLKEEHKDVPCTCTLQFLLRKGKLRLVVYMRSNDAYLGLPHDVFCFTMLQEIVARSVCAEVGMYTHMVGSLHIYKTNLAAVSRFLNEGWQPTHAVMPSMPMGDPWANLRFLRAAERRIRSGKEVDGRKLDQLDPYWADLVRLLELYSASTSKQAARAQSVRSRIHFKRYLPFVDRRLASRHPKN
jgi:thymidylate synthase